MHGCSACLARTLFLLLVLPPLAALGQAQDPALVTAETAFHPGQAVAGAEVEVRVRLSPAPGVHVYKESLSFRWNERQGLEPLSTELPPAMAVLDPAQGPAGPLVDVYEDSFVVRARFRVSAQAGGSARLSGVLSYQACSENVCYPPGELALARSWTQVRPAGESRAGPAPDAEPTPAAQTAEPPPPPGPPRETDEPGVDAGLLLLKILQAFGIGFLISLTPCVYPMIGVTAAIVGSSAGGQKRLLRSLAHSLVYVLGISLTYAVLGVLTALAGAPFAQVLKSGWVLVPVALVFVLLALSMFDVITIQTPAFLRDRLTVSRPAGGLGGKLVLGLASGAVATPCVAAPLIAVLLDIAATAGRHGTAAGVVYGLAALFSLAWGMGVVLVVAGVLSASVLPRSGPWMLWVKKLFGFGMLWAAVYFLQPLLGELAYDLLTSLVLFAGVVFLGGLDRLDRDSTLFDRFRKVLALPALVMAVLLFAGSVNGLTGLFPWLDCGRNAGAARASGTPFEPADAAAVDRALASGRPVVVDVQASWCRVCRKLERETFSDSRVAEALWRVRALSVDYDASPDLVRRWGILGVPTVLFFGPDGREAEGLRFSGFAEPEEMLRRLDALGEGGE